MVGENGKLKPFTGGKTLSREEWVEYFRGQDRRPVDADDAYASYDFVGRFTEVWINDVYSVYLNKKYQQHNLSGCTLWELSIERLDGRAIHDWRDLQAIKNMLVGP